MEKTKKILNRIFIDGLSGMALGLFSTLIIGTIIAQIGTLIGGPVGSYLKAISNVAKTLTGAGIGVGVACKFKEGPLVTVSAAVAGMIGAFPAAPEAITLGAPGEPLGAFVAAYVAIEVGHLVAGKTKVDILVTPLISICAGAAIGLFVGPYITDFMKWLGGLVNVNVEQSPIFGGIIVSVLMGMILTLPISSAAIGIPWVLPDLQQVPQLSDAAVRWWICSCQLPREQGRRSDCTGCWNFYASDSKYRAPSNHMDSGYCIKCHFRTSCICCTSYGKYTSWFRYGISRFCRTDCSIRCNDRGRHVNMDGTSSDCHYALHPSGASDTWRIRVHAQKRLDQRRRYGIKSLIKKKNLIDKRKKSVIIKHVLKIPNSCICTIHNWRRLSESLCLM